MRRLIRVYTICHLSGDLHSFTLSIPLTSEQHCYVGKMEILRRDNEFFVISDDFYVCDHALINSDISRTILDVTTYKYVHTAEKRLNFISVQAL